MASLKIFYRLVSLSLITHSTSYNLRVHIVLTFSFVYVIVSVSPSKAHALFLVSSKKIGVSHRKYIVTFFSQSICCSFNYLITRWFVQCEVLLKKRLSGSNYVISINTFTLQMILVCTKSNFRRFTVIVFRWRFIVCNFSKRFEERLRINFNTSFPLHRIFETIFI